VARYDYVLILSVPDMTGTLEADSYSAAYKKLVAIADELAKKHGYKATIDVLFEHKDDSAHFVG
jgi:hypothetical protein